MTKREFSTNINHTQVKYLNLAHDKEEALLNAIEILSENLSDALSWMGYYYGNTKGSMIMQIRELTDQLEELSVSKFEDIQT